MRDDHTPPWPHPGLNFITRRLEGLHAVQQRIFAWMCAIVVAMGVPRVV